MVQKINFIRFFSKLNLQISGYPKISIDQSPLYIVYHPKFIIQNFCLLNPPVEPRFFFEPGPGSQPGCGRDLCQGTWCIICIHLNRILTDSMYIYIYPQLTFQNMNK